MQVKISACWIVKNEEANIGLSIESVKDIADELVVVDTGSDDGTATLAESLGALVAGFEWTGDFSEARNHAMSLATGDVVVFLDADEWFYPRLGPADRNTIEGLFSNPKAEMLTVKINNLDRQSGAVLDTSVVSRFFRNKETLRYRGRVHEYIAPTHSSANVLVTDALAINHSGYSRDLIREKIGRNVALLEDGFRKAAEGSDEQFLFMTYLIRENQHMGEHKKSSEYLVEILKRPDVLERCCRNHSEEYLSVLYAAIRAAFHGRAGVSRRDVHQKLFRMFKKIYPDYPGTAEIDLLYQAFFDMKEARFFKEFEPAVNAARKKPSQVLHYRAHERFLYDKAALAAWRRGDRPKSIKYATSVLKPLRGGKKHQRSLFIILLGALKDQPPADAIALLNGIFNPSDPDDLDFLIRETCVDGFLTIHTYYLKKRMDSGKAYVGDLLHFTLIHKKYEALVSAAAEAHSAGDVDAARYMFLAAVCGAPPDLIDPHAEMLEKYAHILNAYNNGERLAAVTESDSRLLRETYATVAFTAGPEISDRYLDVFRANPKLCFLTKAVYCEISALPDWLLREDMDGIGRLDFSCRRYVIQAMIAAGRHDEALREIEALLDGKVVVQDLLHMLQVIAEQASGEAGTGARRLHDRYAAMYDALIDIGDVVRTGIVFDDGGKKQIQFFRNMTRPQFDKFLAEEAGRPVTGTLLELYRKAKDVYRQNGLAAEAARCLWRLAAHGRAGQADYEELAEIFAALKNTALPGYILTLAASDNNTKTDRQVS